MNRRTISLKNFMILVLVLGCVAGHILSHYLNAPTVLDQAVLGPISSGEAEVSQTLSLDELAVALSRHKTNGSIIDQVAKLKKADIQMIEHQVEPSQHRPLIGPCELHRSYFLCDTVCELNDGSVQRVRIKVQKNHYQLTGTRKQ